MQIEFEFFETPFGECLAARSRVGICHLAYSGRGRDALISELAAAEPGAELRRGSRWLRERGEALFPEPAADVPLDLRGTPFQLSVWRALRTIPSGATVSYGELAGRIGRPAAARAVAGAVAANRVAWLVPCHRVVRADGGLGGYRWGAARKAAMLECERIVAARAFGDTRAVA